MVFTGGGAMLEGMAEIAEQIFDLPVRRASPEGVGGLADHVNNPAFATSVGLVVYAHRNLQNDTPRAAAGAIGRITGRIRTLFKEFF
jgi:cell division protein FtsA